MFVIFAIKYDRMPRTAKNRSIHLPPVYTAFKPVGLPARQLEAVSLSLDEFEAIRLADKIGLTHEEAAEEMDISRPTFTRLIEAGRGKVALFISEGKILNIEGGNIHFRNNILKCNDCGHMFNISISEEIFTCPSCHSNNLLNFAGGFGHGKCCKHKQHHK